MASSLRAAGSRIAFVAIASCMPRVDAMGTYPDSDDGRCKVGLTFTGLGQLDGDYMGFERAGRSYYRDGFEAGHILQLAYTYSMPNLNHSFYGGNSFGCDEFKGWGPPGGCSKADTAMTRNKWAFFSTPTPIDSAPAKVLAVCEEGCPHWTPDCKDLWTAGGKPPPSDPPYLCPLWPEKWPEKQTWRILSGNGTTKNTTVSATVACCERQPQECDACDSHQTCSGLTGLFHNSCPPEKGSVIFPQTKLQKDCCQTVTYPPLDQKECVCTGSPTVCKH